MKGKIIPVDHDNQDQLYAYCAQYGVEHDGSFQPGRDFGISAEHPSYLLTEGSQVTGAVSLMRTERFLNVGKARFSIFHTRTEDLQSYAALLDAIRPHIEDLKSVFLFIPEDKRKIAGILESLGFEVERYSFILEHRGTTLPDPVFPEGICVYQLTPDDLEGLRQFAYCINEEFKDLAGHTPSSAEFIQTFFDDVGYIAGGLCLLKKGDEPIGTIGLMHDVENMAAGEILAFGILERYRGLGLGRNLLRYGYNFLLNQGLAPVILSVNGENHAAIKLYESEGFQLTESVVCYSLACPG
ncbi:MAG: GNAT family N-acetyltransferase [Anaerolineales bacterium]|jgi:mycothiol synthase